MIIAEEAESSDESSIFSDRERYEAEDAEDSEFHETVDTNVILPNNDNKYVVIKKVRSIEKSSESSTGSVSGSNTEPPDTGHRTPDTRHRATGHRTPVTVSGSIIEPPDTGHRTRKKEERLST